MYKRVLLKISGEALAAGRGFGIDAVFIHKVAEEIAAVHALGCEIAIVVGGGNFFAGWRSRLSIWTASPPITWACCRP